MNAALNFEAWLEQAKAALAVRRAERETAHLARLDRLGITAEHRAYLDAKVDAAPPITPQQRARLRPLLQGTMFPGLPSEPPSRPILSGRAINPKAGTLYAGHLRASDGHCQRCNVGGRREVDHCHEHDVVRGLLCRRCNALSEKSIGGEWRKNCRWCEWDIWLARGLAR